MMITYNFPSNFLKELLFLRMYVYIYAGKTTDLSYASMTTRIV